MSQEQDQPQADTGATITPYKGRLLTGMTKEDRSRYFAIQSPLAVVFYNSPAPDQPVFVNIGDIIEPGTQFGIIEAMKVFSPLAYQGEKPMEVLKILAKNGHLVRKDQILMILRQQ